MKVAVISCMHWIASVCFALLVIKEIWLKCSALTACEYHQMAFIVSLDNCCLFCFVGGQRNLFRMLSPYSMWISSNGFSFCYWINSVHFTLLVINEIRWNSEPLQHVHNIWWIFILSLDSFCLFCFVGNKRNPIKMLSHYSTRISSNDFSFCYWVTSVNFALLVIKEIH